MNVKLIAHTTLSDEFDDAVYSATGIDYGTSDARAAVALTAIRTCYSPNKPTEILPLEGAKYFRSDATDGEGGTEADRLFRHITRSGHTSTLTHINYTFTVEGISRACLAQLTRHKFFDFSVQSQRYVRFGSGDKSGGFDYVTPPSMTEKVSVDVSGWTALSAYQTYMEGAQRAYDAFRAAGIPAEDARFVLPNAAACNLVMTANLRAILEFYAKRKAGKGAQWEIADLAERIREEVTKIDAWTTRFFDEAVS